jgi:hypothetical protein
VNKLGVCVSKIVKKELDVLGEEYELKEIIVNSVSKSCEKMLLIDDTLINNDKDFDDNLNEFYLSREYFHENTKVHLKLKMNLNEYLLITNDKYPALVKIVEIIY